MKTQPALIRTKTVNFSVFFTFIIFSCLTLMTIQAQSQNTTSTEIAQNERVIKGIIKDGNGPLESASVILKGTKTGTTTNSKGEFTFPTPLKTGDVLLISFLGFETQETRIKESTTFLNLTLTEELIEFVGALNSDKPYKSKRSN
ncbi:MAG: carboxypeptidase-like regulatory domain-containing protein [Aquaticitalea sp.]